MYKKTRAIGLLADNLILDGTGSTFLNSNGVIHTPEGRHFFIETINNEIQTVASLDKWSYNEQKLFELMLGDKRITTSVERMLANTHALLRDILNLIIEPLDQDRFMYFYTEITRGVSVVIEPPLSSEEQRVSAKRTQAILSRIVERTNRFEDLRLSERLLDALMMPIIFTSLKPFPTANAAVGIVVQHILLHLLRLPLLTLAKPLFLFYSWALQKEFNTSLKNIKSLKDSIVEYDDHIDVTDAVEQYLAIMVDELRWLRTKLYRMTIHRSLNAEALHRTGRFNSRQEAILIEALLHQDAEFTLQAHIDEYHVAYSTANVDFNKLVNQGLLETTKQGHSFVYTATPLVKELFNDLTDSVHAYELMEQTQAGLKLVDRDLGLESEDFDFPNLTEKASRAMLLSSEFKIDRDRQINMKVNQFLKVINRKNSLPLDLKLDSPNNETIAAIEEGRRIASDPNIKGYTDMDELKADLLSK